MRKKLAETAGERKKFKGTFSRLGKKINYSGYSEDTILLVNIIDFETERCVSDHNWFSFTKGFEKIALTEGTEIEFEARVKPYKKGYVNKQLNINDQKIDFKLSNPTRIRLVTKI
jgi:hypothetical protein